MQENNTARENAAKTEAKKLYLSLITQSLHTQT